jgi:hypothetical protein
VEKLENLCEIKVEREIDLVEMGESGGKCGDFLGKICGKWVKIS